MKKSKRVYTGAFHMITLVVLSYLLYACSNDDESISLQEQATIDLLIGTGYLDNVEGDTPSALGFRQTLEIERNGNLTMEFFFDDGTNLMDEGAWRLDDRVLELTSPDLDTMKMEIELISSSRLVVEDEWEYEKVE